MKLRDLDQFAMAPACKECPASGIKSNTGKPKIEGLVPAGLVVTSIMQITERDPRRQFSGRALEVELVPDHFAVRERLRMIGAGDADRTRHRGGAREKNERQQNHHSHPTNLERDAESSSIRVYHPVLNLFPTISAFAEQPTGIA